MPYNRDHFINLSIFEMMLNNNILNQIEIDSIVNSNNLTLKTYLQRKVKDVFQFTFLKSAYFRNWLTDPIKIHLVN